MFWWSRICRSESVEGSGGAPPPPPPPAPPRQVAPPPPPPRYEEPPPQDHAPRRTPQDQIAELRAEAAQWRISYRNAEQARDDAIERARQAQEQLETAKTAAIAPLQQKLQRAQETARVSAVRAELMALGLQDEDLIHLHTKLPDAPKVEVTDDFEVKGAKELAAAFKKWKPDLFKKAIETPPSDPNPRRRQAQVPDRTSEGGEPPPAEGSGPAIDLRDKTKYPPGSPAYKAAYRAVMNQIPRR